MSGDLWRIRRRAARRERGDAFVPTAQGVSRRLRRALQALADERERSSYGHDDGPLTESLVRQQHGAATIIDEAPQWDAMLDRMQEPGQREAMQAAFDLTPSAMGLAAVLAAARRRGAIMAELDARRATGDTDLIMRALASGMSDAEFAALLAAERAKRRHDDDVVERDRTTTDIRLNSRELRCQAK